MNTSVTQNNLNYKIGLNIHLLSFKLPKKLIQDQEYVRVSITTFPEENKQHFEIKGKKIYCSNHVFTINITNQTDKIVLVFRKKTVLHDNPIIASSTLHLKKFISLPIKEITTGTISTETKVLDVFYPLQRQIAEEKEKCQTEIKRKVLGQMEVQLTFTTPYMKINKTKTNSKKDEHFENYKANKTNKINKNNKKNKQKKNGEYKQINDDNCFISYNLL